MHKQDYIALFHALHPDFFRDEGIRNMPKDWIFTELVLDLRTDRPIEVPCDLPRGITFGEYHGDIKPLRDAVHRVDEEWVQYFNEGDRHFCAFDGEKIVAFCELSDMGRFEGVHIGGPGCVGTIPEYREKGIGLELVRLATETLRRDGFDISWIHYTHLANWYMKLGYKPVLRWNSGGIIAD